MNVLRDRANYFPTYCGDIISVYTRTMGSPTNDTDCNVPTRSGEYDISQNPTFHLSFGPSFMGRGKSNLKNADRIIRIWTLRIVTAQRHLKLFRIILVNF